MIKKYLILLLILLTGACSSKMPRADIPVKDPLTAFFKLCENDMKRASEVIVEKDIVKNLSHLQYMNAGGKRYYILERENISRMINSVTKGVYSDYILINKKGTVLYTKENNDIFAKNVRSHLLRGPLKECYDNRGREIYFSDITTLYSFSEDFVLLIAAPVSGKNSEPGLLILQVDAPRIKRVLKPEVEIVGRDGLYRLPHDFSQTLKPSLYFPEIQRKGIPQRGEEDLTTEGGMKLQYSPFDYRNIHWIRVKTRK